MVEVVQDERGFIGELRLENGGLFPVELVVDCTGFKGLILQQALGEPFEPVGGHLLCDRAIPVQVPHMNAGRLEPCTRSTGLGAGWVWRVPLYSRVGTGYVYSSEFRTDDEARHEFFQHRRAIGEIPMNAPDMDTPVIRMKTGRTRRAWVKNCVAIGLSGAFVEPLEATAIYAIEMSARWLGSYLPSRNFESAVLSRYNQLIEGLYNEIRDFIISHYVTSNRPEPFWQAARAESVLTDTLRENLDLWQHMLPNTTDTEGHKLFIYWSYIYTLWAKEYFKGKHFPMEASVTRAQWDRFSSGLARQKSRLLTVLPDHHALVSQIRAPDGAAQEDAGAPQMSHAGA